MRKIILSKQIVDILSFLIEDISSTDVTSLSPTRPENFVSGWTVQGNTPRVSLLKVTRITRLLAAATVSTQDAAAGTQSTDHYSITATDPFKWQEQRAYMQRSHALSNDNMKQRHNTKRKSSPKISEEKEKYVGGRKHRRVDGGEDTHTHEMATLGDNVRC